MTYDCLNSRAPHFPWQSVRGLIFVDFFHQMSWLLSNKLNDLVSFHYSIYLSLQYPCLFFYSSMFIQWLSNWILVLSKCLLLTIINNTVADLRVLELTTKDGPSDTYALAKWRILNRLHDRNETMYFKVSVLVIFLKCVYALDILLFNALVNFLLQYLNYIVRF